MRCFAWMIVVFSALSAMPEGAFADGPPDQWTELVTTSSECVAAINAALQSMRKLEPGWQNYKVSVIDAGKTYVVTFWRKENEQTLDFVDADGKVLGSWPRLPGSVSVELTKPELEVVSAHFNRD